jgi:hypothetical protein
MYSAICTGAGQLSQASATDTGTGCRGGTGTCSARNAARSLSLAASQALRRRLPATATEDPKELERLLAKVQSDPMIFIIATGEPNACGRGCTERIGAEGEFDDGAAQRFREFTANLEKASQSVAPKHAEHVRKRPAHRSGDLTCAHCEAPR